MSTIQNIDRAVTLINKLCDALGERERIDIHFCTPPSWIAFDRNTGRPTAESAARSDAALRRRSELIEVASRQINELTAALRIEAEPILDAAARRDVDLDLPRFRNFILIPNATAGGVISELDTLRRRLAQMPDAKPASESTPVVIVAESSHLLNELKRRHTEHWACAEAEQWAGDALKDLASGSTLAPTTALQDIGNAIDKIQRQLFELAPTVTRHAVAAGVNYDAFRFIMRTLHDPEFRWPNPPQTRPYEKAVDELEQLRDKLDTPAASPSEPASAEVVVRPPLSHRAAMIYEMLLALPEYRAMTAPQIIDELSRVHNEHIDEGAFYRQYKPELEAYGLEGVRKIGYRIKPDLRPKKQ